MIQAPPPQRRAAPRHRQAAPPQQRRAGPRQQQAAPPRQLQGKERVQRGQPRQQVQPRTGARPQTAGRPIPRTARGPRRSGAPRVTPQVARQGRFAAPFRGGPQMREGRTRTRRAHVAARRAWARGLRAGFVAWYGPVFWPYAYSDIFDYAFWPYGYDDGFWAYAYDDFFDSVFWGQVGPPEAYAYAAPPALRATSAGVQELCTQPGTGITSWPFAEIERKVGLNAEQKQLLDDVRDAANKAAAVFKASCPSQRAFPLTPPGRLRTMMARLQATLEAVQTVRPPLEAFYNSLNDEQKARFNEIGPTKLQYNEEARQALAREGNSCKEPKAGLTNLPIEMIEDVVKPTEAQQADLNRLEEATNKAVAVMQSACPEITPLTPPGRLEAMEKRLQAMIDAANTVKPALDNFYASLSNEQKARFNRLGRELAQSNE
jgi:hypothetical protein